jgi:hypothetical protein
MQGRSACKELREWGGKDKGMPVYRDKPKGRQDNQQDGRARERRRHVKDDAVQKAALPALRMGAQTTQREVGPQRAEQEEGHSQEQDQAEPQLRGGEESPRRVNSVTHTGRRHGGRGHPAATHISRHMRLDKTHNGCQGRISPRSPEHSKRHRGTNDTSMISPAGQLSKIEASVSQACVIVQCLYHPLQFRGRCKRERVSRKPHEDRLGITVQKFDEYPTISSLIRLIFRQYRWSSGFTPLLA